MRRFALFGLLLVLCDCSGFGEFIGDTHTYETNPNAPFGNSETLRRVSGVETTTEPLMPEPGNIWPDVVSPTPTLQDLEKSGNETTPAPSPDMTPYQPDHRQPRPGSSTPPGSNQPGLAPPLQLPPQPAPPVSSVPASPRAGQTVQTPSGTGVTTGGTSAYQTLTTPGGTAIVVPNGNGTSTVIRPDGTVETIPSPR
ncbi:MAG: hypothetical protein JOZ42_02875 [Acetobacteraceae bacterium]|nr:hypothetical protein [Acetobacteraceae bacterium]